MAATRTRSASSTNGGPPEKALAKAQEAGDSVITAARRARGPVLAAGATAAGVAGGLALGSRLNSKRGGLGALLAPRRRILGVPVGRKSGLARTAEALGEVAKELRSASDQASRTTEDVHQIRDTLEASNRRSPVEVVLDGLTHRRGAHRRES